MKKTSLTALKYLITSLIKEVVEQDAVNVSPPADETFIDHIRGWIELMLEHLFHTGRYAYNSAEHKQVIAAINQDVEDNSWLEYDLGAVISSQPGELFTDLVFKTIRTLHSRRDPLLSQVMFASQDKVTLTIYLIHQAPRDTATLNRVLDYLTDTIIDLMPNVSDNARKEVKPHGLTRFYISPPAEKQIHRAIVRACFEDLLRWSNADNDITNWQPDTERISKEITTDVKRTDVGYDNFKHTVEAVINQIRHLINHVCYGQDFSSGPGHEAVMSEIYSLFEHDEEKDKEVENALYDEFREVPSYVRKKRHHKLIDVPRNPKVLDIFYDY